MSSYGVYLVQYLGIPLNHHGIFVETEATGDGVLFHVRSNIQQGMVYERKGAKKPEESVTFEEKEAIGWVDANDMNRFDAICRSNPAPAKQFNGPRRMGHRQPLRRCQEWTAETIQDLKSEGVLYSTCSYVASLSSRAESSRR